MFAPIVPVELADREDKDHDSKKKKGQNNSFQCVFLLQQDFGVYSPFLAEVPLHKASPIPMSLLSTSVTICVCLKY